MSTTPVLKSKAGIENLKSGMDEEDRSQLQKGVLQVLADTYILYVKTQSFHWNVVGPLFYSLHKLSEEQYKELAEAIDEIAERVRALGYPVPTSLRQFADHGSIEEEEGTPSGQDMIAQLVDNHEALARELRQTITLADDANDQATVDVLTKRLCAHEKSTWMLRSIIE
jgi:starvation-inducible DNA-binding protein